MLYRSRVPQTDRAVSSITLESYESKVESDSGHDSGSSKLEGVRTPPTRSSEAISRSMRTRAYTRMANELAGGVSTSTGNNSSNLGSVSSSDDEEERMPVTGKSSKVGYRSQKVQKTSHPSIVGGTVVVSSSPTASSEVEAVSTDSSVMCTVDIITSPSSEIIVKEEEEDESSSSSSSCCDSDGNVILKTSLSPDFESFICESERLRICRVAVEMIKKGLLNGIPIRDFDKLSRDDKFKIMNCDRPNSQLTFGLLRSGLDLRLGEKGRSDLKQEISRVTKYSPALKEACFGIVRLKHANIYQLLQLAEICDVFDKAAVISRAYWADAVRKKQRMKSSTSSVSSNAKSKVKKEEQLSVVVNETAQTVDVSNSSSSSFEEGGGGRHPSNNGNSSSST